MAEKQKKCKRGFASMDKARQKEIAGQGGRAAHAQGTAHRFTKEEAAEAGRKGGIAAKAARDARAQKESGAQK